MECKIAQEQKMRSYSSSHSNFLGTGLQRKKIKS